MKTRQQKRTERRKAYIKARNHNRLLRQKHRRAEQSHQQQRRQPRLRTGRYETALGRWLLDRWTVSNGRRVRNYKSMVKAIVALGDVWAVVHTPNGITTKEWQQLYAFMQAAAQVATSKHIRRQAQHIMLRMQVAISRVEGSQ